MNAFPEELFIHQNSEIAAERKLKYKAILDSLFELHKSILAASARIDEMRDNPLRIFVADKLEQIAGELIALEQAILWGRE